MSKGEDCLVDAIVNDATGMMAASLVSAKWQCVLEELMPLLKPGKLEEVSEILMRYWPPDVEIEQLKQTGLS